MRVRVTDLGHRYVHRRGVVETLAGVSFEVPSGAFVAVIGPSGCGKSTLLRLLAGLLEPARGRVLLDGGRTPQDPALAKRIAWMAQSPALLPWKTVLGNVRLALEVNPRPTPGPLRPEEMLTRVGLGEFMDFYPGQLSGGMQQRAALARALVQGADLWLMDESFASLDELTRETLAQEVLQLWMEFRPTVIWVTHHVYEAVRLADVVLVLSPRPGRVTAQVTVSLPRPREETEGSFLERVRLVRRRLGLAVA